MAKSQNIYKYKKITPLKGFACKYDGMSKNSVDVIHMMKNKIDELVIEQNHMAKDLEMYKEAFRNFVRDQKDMEKQRNGGLLCRVCEKRLENCHILNCSLCPTLPRYCFTCNIHVAADLFIRGEKKE